MTIEEATNLEAVPQISPGLRLSAERKKQGLDERAVAEQLKITLSKLQCIEKDQFDSFPAQIYLKGYLKNYARLLGISEQEIIESYQAHAGHRAEEVHYTPSQGATSDPSSSKGVFISVALFVIAILIFVLYSQFIAPKERVSAADAAVLFEPPVTEAVSGSFTDELQVPVEVLSDIADQVETDVATDVEAIVATDPAAALQNIDPIQSVDEPVEMLASKLTAVELINLSAPEVEEQLPAPEVVSLADILDFRFTNQCWIEVRDNTGSLLYSGLENAGSNRKIEGVAPFQVVIGNVEGTLLSLNGEGVLLQAPVDGRPLRLQVGS